mgnify:CR=1 FL=1
MVLFHDHGSRYVGKMFNDEWMKDRGFLESEPNALGLIEKHKEHELVTAKVDEKVSSVVQKMQQFGISQIPVFDKEKNVGSLTESIIFSKLTENIRTKTWKNHSSEFLVIFGKCHVNWKTTKKNKH